MKERGAHRKLRDGRPQITVHVDVTACIRWTLFGIAAVLVAVNGSEIMQLAQQLGVN